jgi:16S rRNA (adenine1518-N6/adenine1519-N6)-dimethyltransferase
MEVRAKKKFGQNFLADPAVVREIVSIARVTPGTPVLEVGPGTGALTEALLSSGARVLALEIDASLVERLAERFRESEGLSLVEGNILEVDVAALVEAAFGETPYLVVANIPYYITAPIIKLFLTLGRPPEALTLMVQEEVADRLAAEAGDMSLLSLMAQYYASVEKKRFVPKESFVPVPKVDSRIVRLVPYRAYDAARDRTLFRVARAGFAKRRKTLANNLAALPDFSKEAVEAFLLARGLSKDARAQALTISDWEALVERFSETPGK